MELYVGGAWQGKLEYVLKKYKKERTSGCRQDIECVKESEPAVVQGENCCRDDMKEADIINHFHIFVRRELEAGRELGGFVSWLCGVNPDVIIICDEVGSGIIPADKNERDYRVSVGRLLCEAAGLSQHMERITGGIGMKIK